MFTTMLLVLLVLSIIGLYISLYFTLVFYRVNAPGFSLVPAFCRMEEGTCQLVIRHPDAAVLGLPNSLLGVGYYLILIFIAAGPGSPTIIPLMRLASWIPVVLGMYLMYSLFFKVRVTCLLCLVSHVLNLVIALLFTLWR